MYFTCLGEEVKIAKSEDSFLKKCLTCSKPTKVLLLISVTAYPLKKKINNVYSRIEPKAIEMKNVLLGNLFLRKEKLVIPP